jgi:predicted phosphoribosyltransferase
LRTPELFYTIGQFYEDFSELKDAEEIELLQRAAPAPAIRIA